MRKFAVLIDAGFIKRKLGSQSNPITAERVDQFVSALAVHHALKNAHLHRVYFYDAPPLEQKVEKPLQGGSLNFGASMLASANKSLHSRLARLPYFALRFGELAFRGWKLTRKTLETSDKDVTIKSSDLSPDVQQKGVDMRIGLDIASLTLKHHVDILVLVTGDSDFIPAMKFARREGAQLLLVTFDHSVKDALYEHADLLLEFDQEDLARD